MLPCPYCKKMPGLCPECGKQIVVTNDCPVVGIFIIPVPEESCGIHYCSRKCAEIQHPPPPEEPQTECCCGEPLPEKPFIHPWNGVPYCSEKCGDADCRCWYGM
jgi:hypothetical protein